MIDQFSDAQLAALLSLRRYDPNGREIKLDWLRETIEISAVNHARVMALRAGNWKMYVQRLERYLEWFA